MIFKQSIQQEKFYGWVEITRKNNKKIWDSTIKDEIWVNNRSKTIETQIKQERDQRISCFNPTNKL